MIEMNSDGVRDAVAAAFADLPDADVPSPIASTEEDVPRGTSDEGNDSSDETSGEGRGRDEKGRFSKTEQKAVVAKEIQGSTAPAQKAIDQSEELDPGEASKTPILAPNSWSTEEKAKFATLPSDVKEVITRREKERDNFIFQKSEELSKAQRRYAEIDELIGPREQQLSFAGMTPAAYLRQVIAGADMLDANPVAAIQQFINHYGIHPQQLFGGQQQQVDPYQARLDNIEQELQLRRQQAEEAQRAQLVNGYEQQIQQYRNEVDSSGAPLRPYFDSVSAHINSLIPLIRGENPAFSVKEVLDKAYDQAMYANPQVRSEILKREKAMQEAKNIENAKKRSAEAKSKGGSISGAPGGGSVQSAAGLRSIVESAFNEHVR